MRRRDTERWGISKMYPSPRFWSRNEVVDGLHTIQIGNQFLDILIRDRGSDTTLVTFQHRVSVRTAYPMLVGESFTRETNVNLIAIADPSVSLSNDVRLGWYLGNRAIGHLKPTLVPILVEAVAAFEPRRLIFFGTSGGRYAAMNYAAEFTDSIAFTVNPRLGFGNRQDADWSVYMSECHRVQGRTPYNRVSAEYGIDLRMSIPSGSPFYAAMYHNIGDARYYEANHKPFVDSRASDLRIFQRLDFDGSGHVPIPRSKLVEIVRSLSDLSLSSASAIRNAGFLCPT
ncbi:hypothetical protein [Corynebacterium sp. HMSC074C01]|uniref:hypothetical protein n=1 Tax=Corynebacterium sp. HMSC074C01 TaxID=1739482 RepID=UPI0011787EE2|nr:hypothetical protein [Corynebacterium sp. HMSC074C01]